MNWKPAFEFGVVSTKATLVIYGTAIVAISIVVTALLA